MRLDDWSSRFSRLWLTPTEDPLEFADADLVLRHTEPAEADDPELLSLDDAIESFYPEDRASCPWCGQPAPRNSRKGRGTLANERRPIVIPKRRRRRGL